MRTIIVANTIPDDTDDIVLARYKTSNGAIILSNVAVGAFDPFTGKIMQRVDASDMVTASESEVEDKLVTVCSCVNCNENINVDPKTGQSIVASLEDTGEDVNLFCVTCGTENKVSPEDLHSEDEPEDHHEDHHDDGDDDDDLYPEPDEDDDDEDDRHLEGDEAHGDIDHKTTASGDDEPEDHHEDHHDDDGDDDDLYPEPDSDDDDGDEGEDDEDHHDDDDDDDDDDEGAGDDESVEAALYGDIDEVEPEEVVASTQPVMASTNLSDRCSSLRVSAYECLAGESNPMLTVRPIADGKAMVFNVSASGAFVPVMELDASLASPSNKALFNNPSLLDSAFKQICASDGFELNVANLASLGARDITFSIPVAASVKRRIDQGINSVTASLSSERESVIDDMRQCLAIAFTETVKGVRSDRPNPLRESILASVETLGVKDAAYVVDDAFETSGEAVCASIVDRALDLMAKPVDVRNEISTMVEAACYRGVDSSTSAAVNASLAKGNVPFTPSSSVTASLPSPTPATQQRAPAATGRFSHCFGRIERMKGY